MAAKHTKNFESMLSRFIGKHTTELRPIQRNHPRSLLPPHQWTSHRLAHSPSPAVFSPSSPNTTALVSDRLPSEFLALLDSVAECSNDEHVSRTMDASPTLSACLLNGGKVRELAVRLAKTHMPGRSLQLLRLASAFGTPLKQNVYECTAHQLASERRWEDVLTAVSLGMQHTKLTTVRLLNWRTRGLVEQQDYLALKSVLSDFSKFGLSPNRRTFHLLLAGHIQNHDLHQAKDCLQRMLACGCPPDASTYALLASVFRPLGIDSHVQYQAVEALPSVHGRGCTSTAVLNSLLQMHLDSRRPTNDIFNLVSLYDQPSLAPAIPAVIETGTRVLDVESSLDHRPPSLRPPDLPPIRPNAETFTILLNHAASRRDLSCAMLLIDVMSSTGVKLTADTVTSLLHVLFATGNDGAAIQLVSDICGAKAAPLFRGLSSSHPLNSLPIPVIGILPTTQIFNALLKGVLGSSGFRQWSLVLRIMHIHGLQPNAATAEVILTYLDKVEGARPRDLLRVLRFISSARLKPNLRHLHVVIRSIFRREKFKVRGSGWKSNASRMSQLPLGRFPPAERLLGVTDTLDPMAGLQFTTRHRLRSLVRPILRSLGDRGVRSDAAMFAMRIRHDGVVRSDLDSAREAFDTLLARGMRPSAYHFAALMEGYALSGNILGAEDVMQAAADSGISPNVVMFTILIVGHGRKGKPQLALRTFQRMVAVGIKPDVPAIDAVASAFFAVGARGMARQILLALWPHISPFPPELAGTPLLDLARRFRKLHNTNPSPEPLTKEQGALLRYRITRLLQQWSRMDDNCKRHRALH